MLDAHDGVADVQLNGGPGADTALFDRGLDPRTFAVETRVPLDPPPPVTPVTDCDFAGGVVSATMAPSTEATLEVRGGAIRFGAPEEDCGAATTTNTERITVSGASGSRETLVINLRSGRLGPGIPSEAGRSEIEVEVNLEDPGDVVRVIGPHTRASFALGSQGLALNADGDVDVIVDPVPVSISLVGGRGRDRLTAAGGHGAGGRFAGRAELRGAGAADILVGGNGRDRLYGGPGADHLVGAGRADVFSGGGGDDILRAVDLLRDRSVAGDAGRDTVFFDRGLDRPVQCELLRPRSG